MNKTDPLTVEIASERLAPYINPDYRWPDVPLGWQLEFIAFQNGDIEMDFLHPVSGCFWSDENDMLEIPTRLDGTPITVWTLQAACVPFMTTFGIAQVAEQAREPHLKAVEGHLHNVADGQCRATP